MGPTVCSTTPTAPHFGHLFVGLVGAGTWMGMRLTLTGCERAAGRLDPEAHADGQPGTRVYVSAPGET
jgi:hypothetical protein